MVEVFERGNIEKVEKPINLSPTEFPDNSRIKESMDFAIKHKTILERVKSILRYDKLARKDYWWLQALFYAKCGFIKELMVLENFRRKPSPESINRCRRELFKKAKGGDKELAWLLTDKEFIEDIKKEEELYRNYYSDQKTAHKNSALATQLK